jgi:hypothetical protein
VKAAARTNQLPTQSGDSKLQRPNSHNLAACFQWITLSFFGFFANQKPASDVDPSPLRPCIKERRLLWLDRTRNSNCITLLGTVSAFNIA